MKKYIKKSYHQNRPIITVEESYLFGLLKYETEYLGIKPWVENKYWSWVKLPNYTIVDDMLSHQLDTWAQIEK